MSPTRDRLVLIVPFFLWGPRVLVMAGTYCPALLRACVCACVCVSMHFFACAPFLSPLLLFPVVISERKVIRCLIEGAGKGEEGERVAGMNPVASYHTVHVQHPFARALREICGGYEAERQDVSMKSPNRGATRAPS